MATFLRAAGPSRTGRLARDLVFAALAVTVIAMSADVRMPMALPGHRGLIWLTVLVTTALVTRTRATVVAVGAGATLATLVLQLPPGPWAGLRYVAAALLLCAVAATGSRWLVAVAAAPIHLVALAGSSEGAGMLDKVLFHLGFGLVAGLLGWAIASVLDRAARPRAGRS
ncbi:hypothetical protein [Mycobacterium kubicae]|uniref:hypothetical protein n=1 Tax=Mycobacterium kubicae TaxID=120959 RepID=UPI0007FF9238|nr:hypothetical protein [Mycobacterium kubicae]OBK51270.1 hypothetical protein A5657_18670 [Mycobacterium kubicae]